MLNQNLPAHHRHNMWNGSSSFSLRSCDFARMVNDVGFWAMRLKYLYGSGSPVILIELQEYLMINLL
jgi:hypothetical protein